jgi:cell division protein FtsZ
MELYDFSESEELTPARIKVIGVGGGGCNAVNRMIVKGLKGVEFYALNTDAQALARSEAEHRIHLGNGATHGLGAGGLPETGRKAAEETEAILFKALDGADMVFVTAGMGGGTGTGAAPVVSRIAKALGALTIGIVTTPFSFEGKRRTANAQLGIVNLEHQVDTLIVIPNDRLLQVVDPHASLNSAFSMADDILHQGIQAISELITEPGLINLDFADVRTIMQGGGAALMSIGYGKGEERARRAAEGAITNPLLDLTIHGAQGVLLNIMAGPDVTLFEVNEAASIIREVAHPDANVIFGAVINPEMKEEMRISIIATGFWNELEPSEITRPSESVAQATQSSNTATTLPKDSRRLGSTTHHAMSSSQTSSAAHSLTKIASSRQAPPVTFEALTTAPIVEGEGIILSAADRDETDFTPRIINTDNLDVPTFLRNRIRSQSTST